MLKILSVVGARPNFMKIAPVIHAISRRATEFTSVLVHTGQHYDAEMSEGFFRDLDLPPPDHHLGVGSASHAAQTANVMLRFEPVLTREKPDWTLVVGDVNSTLACTLVCAKLGARVAHVEAGLRSYDRTMPEEINRVLTDAAADLLLTPSADADRNLRREGIPEERIEFVGNVMIDALHSQSARAAGSTIRERLGVDREPYAVATLHRPSNTDHRETLDGILRALVEISRRLPVIFPVHPRTRKSIAGFGLDDHLRSSDNLRLIDPLGYVDFLRLYSGARLVLTDSGGIQEETTALGIPCLTLRETTERPVTVELGTNRVVGCDPSRIIRSALEALHSTRPDSAPPPPLWDGRTADRILDALARRIAASEHAR